MASRLNIAIIGYGTARQLLLGKLPGGSGHILRILGGTQHDWFGKLSLQPEFIAALSEHHPPL